VATFAPNTPIGSGRRSLAIRNVLPSRYDLIPRGPIVELMLLHDGAERLPSTLMGVNGG